MATEDKEPRKRRADEANEDDDALLVQKPDDAFEDYDELNGDNDATPDDRRRDPLRKAW